jgi:hypothetical protein
VVKAAAIFDFLNRRPIDSRSAPNISYREKIRKITDYYVPHYAEAQIHPERTVSPSSGALR